MGNGLRLLHIHLTVELFQKRFCFGGESKPCWPRWTSYSRPLPHWIINAGITKPPKAAGSIEAPKQMPLEEIPPRFHSVRQHLQDVPKQLPDEMPKVI